MPKPHDIARIGFQTAATPSCDTPFRCDPETAKAAIDNLIAYPDQYFNRLLFRLANGQLIRVRSKPQ